MCFGIVSIVKFLISESKVLNIMRKTGLRAETGSLRLFQSQLQSEISTWQHKLVDFVLLVVNREREIRHFRSCQVIQKILNLRIWTFTVKHHLQRYHQVDSSTSIKALLTVTIMSIGFTVLRTSWKLQLDLKSLSRRTGWNVFSLLTEAKFLLNEKSFECILILMPYERPWRMCSSVQVKWKYNLAFVYLSLFR